MNGLNHSSFLFKVRLLLGARMMPARLLESILLAMPCCDSSQTSIHLISGRLQTFCLKQVGIESREPSYEDPHHTL